MAKYVVYIVLAILTLIFVAVLKNGIARADCKDGTVSYSKNRSGTCSRHGGVAKWR